MNIILPLLFMASNIISADIVEIYTYDITKDKPDVILKIGDRNGQASIIGSSEGPDGVTKVRVLDFPNIVDGKTMIHYKYTREDKTTEVNLPILLDIKSTIYELNDGYKVRIVVK